MMTLVRNLFGRAALALFTVAVVLIAADVALACPSCQAALASQEGGGRVVQGFFWSILFMMSMPFSILTALSTYFYLLVRRARRQEAVPVPANGHAIAEQTRTSSR